MATNVVLAGAHHERVLVALSVPGLADVKVE